MFQGEGERMGGFSEEGGLGKGERERGREGEREPPLHVPCHRTQHWPHTASYLSLFACLAGRVSHTLYHWLLLSDSCTTPSALSKYP